MSRDSNLISSSAFCDHANYLTKLWPKAFAAARGVRSICAQPLSQHDVFRPSRDAWAVGDRTSRAAHIGPSGNDRRARALVSAFRSPHGRGARRP